MPCRAVSCLPRTAPCRRAGRAVPHCLVPGYGPRHGGPPGQGCDTLVSDLNFLFYIELADYISYSATQDGWMDGWANIPIFSFFRINMLYFLLSH